MSTVVRMHREGLPGQPARQATGAGREAALLRALEEGEIRRVGDTRSRRVDVRGPTPGVGGTPKERVRGFERECIEAALRESRGNGARAARALGVTRQLLHRRIHDLGLEPRRFAESVAC